MKKNFIIIANGAFLPAAQLKAMVRGKVILALDGAADRLKKIKLTPDILLGDFDSIKNLSAWKNKKTEVIHAPDQNKTDLEKAIEYCQALGAKQIDLACATEGRLDHSLHNLSLLKRYYRKSCPIFLHTKSETVCYLKTGEFIFSGEKGERVALFGFPKARVSSKGLKYELEAYSLEMGQSASVSNAMKAKKFSLRVKGEALLIGPLMHFGEVN